MNSANSNHAALVVLPNWLGDLVMAQPLLQLLQSQGWELDALAPAWTQPLIERIPQLRAGYKLGAEHGELALRRRWRLGRLLAANNYGAAYVLPNSLKSALVPAFAGIARRVGWRGEWRFYWLNDIRLLDQRRYPLMYQRYAALAFAPGQDLAEVELPRPQLRSEPERARAWLEEQSMANAGKLLALAPGAAYGPSKRWPLAYFAEVANWALRAGWRVICLGGPEERALGQELGQAIATELRSAWLDCCGRIRLDLSLDLLSVADALVANDSGLAHVAAAVDCPPLVLYGPTNAKHTPPLHPEARIVQRDDLDCRPCHRRQCPLGHHDCLRGIAATKVIDLLVNQSA